MCHESCINFGKANLKEAYIVEKAVIEVGSLDVNGSLRPIVELFRPSIYIGVDIGMGPGVDLVCDAEDLISRFGYNIFDLVICTELLEHVRNWKIVIHNLKQILRPDGILLITTRSKGFAYHGYPSDYWRYEISDIKSLFADFTILVLENDPEAPGVFFLGKKSCAFSENKLKNHYLYSILAGRKTSIFLNSIYGLTLYKKAIRAGYYIKHPFQIPGMIKRKIGQTY